MNKKESTKIKIKNRPIKKTKKELECHPTLGAKRTFGQKASDNLTKWAGSWVFIFLFAIIIIAWIWLNSYYLVMYYAGNPPDPYPFILLNLALSMLAAIQAPIILMSQNRGAQKDRIRAEYDYAVNRKAEREISEIKDLIIKLHKKRT